MGKYSLASKKKSKVANTIKILIIIVIVIIVGIAIYIKKNHKDEEQINKNVNSAFSSLKELNKEDIEKYLDYNSLISGLDDMIIEKENFELEKVLFKDISWNVGNIEAKSDRATATVELTNKNFKNILTAWMKKIVNEKIETSTISQELALSKLQEAIEQETVNKTVVKEIKLEKSEGNWKIEVDDNFIDLVYPGIDSVAEVLN